MGELFVESDERSSTEEILSVSVANGIYPASESERDTNPGASIANYKIVRVGDIVYNSMRMWQGAVGSSRYNGIVSPAYVVAKPVVELDSTCFGYLLKRPELLYKYLCNSQGNSKDTQTLRYERFAEITAEVPSTIEEQRAISDCLEGLDSLITLHQRKRKYRGLYGYLSWEQRKLGDLISVYIAHAGPEEDVTVLTSSRDGIQKQEDHFGRLQQHDTSDWNLIPYGYCTYRNRSDDGLFTFNVNKVADRGIVSKFYPVFETPECDADFLVAYLNSSQEIRKKLFVLAVGTSQVVLSYGALKELSLLLPQNREQSAIANVLNHIDNLITLHQ